MHEDCAALGLDAPDLEPRATQFIEPILAMTQTLIDKGFAYVASDGGSNAWDNASLWAQDTSWLAASQWA